MKDAVPSENQTVMMAENIETSRAVVMPPPLLFIGASMLGGVFATIVLAVVAHRERPVKLLESLEAIQLGVALGFLSGWLVGFFAFAFLAIAAIDEMRLPRTGPGWSMLGFGAGFAVTGGLPLLIGRLHL